MGEGEVENGRFLISSEDSLLTRLREMQGDRDSAGDGERLREKRLLVSVGVSRSTLHRRLLT